MNTCTKLLFYSLIERTPLLISTFLSLKAGRLRSSKNKFSYTNSNLFFCFFFFEFCMRKPVFGAMITSPNPKLPHWKYLHIQPTHQPYFWQSLPLTDLRVRDRGRDRGRVRGRVRGRARGRGHSTKSDQSPYPIPDPSAQKPVPLSFCFSPGVSTYVAHSHSYKNRIFFSLFENELRSRWSVPK